MLEIILTNDYEVSGDGTSSVCDLVNKTKTLQRNLDAYGVSQSLFPDICELYSFKKYDSQLKKHYGYSPYDIFKTQLEELHSKGNDIQLHFHPQWFNSSFVNGGWILNNNLWRISSKSIDLPYFLDKYLSFFSDEFPHVNLPTVFRAGGYCIQPSKDIFSVLNEFNIYYDSSVSINTIKYDQLKYYNFTSKIKSRQWNFDNDVLKAKDSAINTELPIASINLDNPLKDFIKKIYNNKHSFRNIKKLSWNNSYRRIDFTVMDSSQLINSILKYIDSTDNDYGLILLTGHSKHYNSTCLNEFLDYFTKKADFSFTTLTKYINGYSK